MSRGGQWRPGQKEAVLAQARAKGMLPSEQPAKQAETRAPAPNVGALTPKTGLGSAPESQKPRRAKEPNRTEREYELMLKAQYPAATVRWEAYTLRLASRATYTPDYSVSHPDGRVDFHEVKGSYIFPKALVKLRIAAAHFPHLFFLAQKLKSGWEITELANH